MRIRRVSSGVWGEAEVSDVSIRTSVYSCVDGSIHPTCRSIHDVNRSSFDSYLFVGRLAVFRGRVAIFIGSIR